LEEIITLAKVSEKTAKKISILLSHIQVRYFGDFLDNIPRQERAEIPTEFFDLRPKELEELIRALEIHVPYVKEDLVTILNKEEITIQDVYESLFWKIVQLAGVEEKFRPEIEKMFVIKI
jgi:hypothetical protein